MRFSILYLCTIFVAMPVLGDGEKLIPIPPESEPKTEIQQPVEKIEATTAKSIVVKAKNTPVARVARVIVHKGIIRAQPKEKSLLFYRCAKGTELAVLGQQGNWSKVVMSDHSIGWMRTNQLCLTDVQVAVTELIVTMRNHAVKHTFHKKRTSRRSGLNKRDL